MIRIKSNRVARDKNLSMKSSMTNPIQQVLEAEREARDKIDETQRQADADLSTTRRTAKQLLKRNEQRTQQALIAYEQKQQQLTEAAAERLRLEAGVELQHAQTRVDANFEALVDETFTAFWPVKSG